VNSIDEWSTADNSPGEPLCWDKKKNDGDECIHPRSGEKSRDKENLEIMYMEVRR